MDKSELLNETMMRGKILKPLRIKLLEYQDTLYQEYLTKKGSNNKEYGRLMMLVGMVKESL